VASRALADGSWEDAREIGIAARAAHPGAWRRPRLEIVVSENERESLYWALPKQLQHATTSASGRTVRQRDLLLANI
jgi:hypothetical protein